MSGNRTFTMVKPDAVRKNAIGPILAMINEAGFKIIAMKYTKLSTEQAGAFYEVHKERPFYGELVDFMSSGPIVAAILEKDNAIADYRTLIGATNPAEAADGTIRKLYASNIGENAVHGADSDENAIREGRFFFSEREMFA
ncbi:MAG: nucleoside-diphosphate kinase [Chitinophagales bacterium]